MTRRVVFVPDDYWTNPPQENNTMDELDHARALVAEAVAQARSGERLDAVGLADRWQGSPITLIGAALLAAVGPHDDLDPNPAPRDFRRATAFLSGWATGDPAVFSPPVEEAAADGRMQHLLAAVGEHAVLGLGLRHDPAQLAELRRSIAVWTREEHTEEN